MSTDPSTTDSNITRDPAQLIPPYIDTRLTLWIIPAREIRYFVPGSLLFIAAWTAYAMDHIPLLLATSIAGTIVTITAFALVLRAHEFTTPADLLRTAALRAKLRYALPWTHEDAAADPVHGVRRIYNDGSAAMDDGRLVGLVRVNGRNTDQQTKSERNLLASQLADGIDEDIHNFNFKFYSTTTPFDIDTLTETYDQQAFSTTFGGDEWAPARELLHNIGEWIADTDAPRWQARKWQHYIAVEVYPDEVTPPDHEQLSQSRGRRLLNTIIPGQTQSTESRRRELRGELDDRLTTIETAVIGNLAGCTAERVSATEHALLLARYWAGVDHTFDETAITDDLETAVWPWIGDDGAVADTDQTHRPAAVEATPTVPAQSGIVATDRISSTDGSAIATESPATDADGTRAATSETLSVLTRLREGLFAPLSRGTNHEANGTLPQRDSVKELFAPAHYDVRDGHTQVGDQYCRTFWIADWPAEPDSQFLRDLYTLRDVDVDVCIHARARDKRDTIHELEHEIAEVDANALEREADTDVSAMAADDTLAALVKMYKLLRQTNSQPWDVAGYVTVRAGTRRALDHAEAELADGMLDDTHLTLDIAKQRALEADADRVTSILEGAPASLFALAPAARQGELFTACSPTGWDAYADASQRDRYVTTLGGTLGAMFPFCSAIIQEDDGVEFGRNMQNGSELIVDPFDRGGAPHQLTCAKSGSGKTYAVGKRALRWWLADPDRTLVLCDTMGEFAGLTAVTNGEHIVVDGTQTINPLAIERPPDHVREQTDIDPYRMKVDEAREFLAGILRAQGIDPGPFVATIEEALEQTYEQARIYPGEIDSHARESPTMADFLETLADMLANPGAYTHTDHSREIDEKERQVARLLDKLSGFKPRGKYRHLVGHSDVRIQPSNVTYLDLQQIEGQGAAEKSTLLHLMLGQVYQMVKRAPDQTLFVIDEAHYLLHSSEMIAWLQRAARHWRHYDAGMWFVSQSPGEFVATAGDDASDHRETITGQCSTIEFYRTPNLSLEDGRTFGMNDQQIEFVRNRATPGSAGLGYSQGLVSFADQPGWIRTQVAAAPVEDLVLTYDPQTHGPFTEYLADHWDVSLPTDGATENAHTATASSPSDEQPTTTQQPTDVEAIRGIGTTYADRLRAVGINTIHDLGEQAPASVAEVANTSITQAETWIARANEQRLQEVSR